MWQARDETLESETTKAQHCKKVVILAKFLTNFWAQKRLLINVRGLK